MHKALGTALAPLLLLADLVGPSCFLPSLGHRCRLHQLIVRFMFHTI